MGNYSDSFELTSGDTHCLCDLHEALSPRTMAIIEEESPTIIASESVSSVTPVLLQATSWCSLKMFSEHYLLRTPEMQMVPWFQAGAQQRYLFSLHEKSISNMNQIFEYNFITC